VAALIDTAADSESVTTGNIRLELRSMGTTKRAGGGNPKESDLSVEAGWGHAGKDGITMPDKGGLFARPYSTDERKAILGGAKALDFSEKQIFACLGEKTWGAYLNGAAYWPNIPSRVGDSNQTAHLPLAAATRLTTVLPNLLRNKGLSFYT